MNKFLKILEKMDDFYSKNGVGEEEIINAEKALGLSFSKEYKEYLKKYAIASADGHEFTGLIESKRLNVVYITEKFRDKLDIPKELYVVEDLYIDHIIIWQNAQGEVFKTVGKESPKKIAESLAEYLN